MGERLGLCLLDMEWFDEAGSFERLLIVFHALRLLWVMLVVVMTSSHLFFFTSFMLFISTLPVFMVPLSNSRLYTVSCTLHTGLLIPLIYRICSLFCILLEYATRRFSTNPPYFSGMGSTTSISLSSYVE